MRGVNRFADRWIRLDQLRILAWIPDSACLEVRIVDRIINFRSALVNILVYCRLIFSVSIFSRHKIFCDHTRWTIMLDLQIDRGLDKLNATYIFAPSYLMLGLTATQTISKWNTTSNPENKCSLQWR